MPVTVIAGDRDHRYQSLARRMVELLPDAELAVIAGGHRLPLENPGGVVRALEGLH
jgi:pimeloyl-ACP methyl ester carboxylesterase